VRTLVLPRVHLVLANISVGAKHDRSQYGIITNNLYAVMLRPLQKPDAPPSPLFSDDFNPHYESYHGYFTTDDKS
jgi:hypothetical protein